MKLFAGRMKITLRSPCNDFDFPFLPGEDKVVCFFLHPELDLTPDNVCKSATPVPCVPNCKHRKKLRAVLHKDKRLQEQSCENEDK